LRDIEQALENFKRLPTVDTDIQITPAVGPQAQPGESDVVISWKQSRTLRLSASLDDAGSRRTGRHQAGTALSLDNLWMANDRFYAHYNRGVFNGGGKSTAGYALHYSIPYGYWLLSATTSGYKYQQTIVGFIQSYDYSGTSANGDLRLSRVLYRDATRKTDVHVRAWTQRSRNFIDDTEVSVQRRRTGGWETGMSHLEYIGTTMLDANVAYRWGTGAFGAIAAPQEAFGEGMSRSKIVTADTRLTVPISVQGQRLRYIVGWRVQWNCSRLMLQDHLAIGGRYSVRGFDGELMLLGERGWVWRNDLGWQVGGNQELYVGADVGHVSSPATQWLPSRRLAGGVAGLRGGQHGFFWDVFVGTPLHQPKTIKISPTIGGFNLSWVY
jgi:hemolysin activation/secretion protein